MGRLRDAEVGLVRQCPAADGTCRTCGKRSFVDEVEGVPLVREHWTQDPAARRKAAAANRMPPACRGTGREPMAGSVEFPLIRFGGGSDDG